MEYADSDDDDSEEDSRRPSSSAPVASKTFGRSFGKPKRAYTDVSISSNSDFELDFSSHSSVSKLADLVSG